VNFADLWSGRWESNPRPKLGKLLYCHCTTPAHRSSWLIIQQLSNSVYRLVIFHIFQTAIFAILYGKCIPDLFGGNLSGVWELAGTNPAVIRQRMGHSSAAMTEL
jgi:hypothetical protein